MDTSEPAPLDPWGYVEVKPKKLLTASRVRSGHCDGVSAVNPSVLHTAPRARHALQVPLAWIIVFQIRTSSIIRYAYAAGAVVSLGGLGCILPFVAWLSHSQRAAAYLQILATVYLRALEETESRQGKQRKRKKEKRSASCSRGWATTWLPHTHVWIVRGQALGASSTSDETVYPLYVAARVPKCCVKSYPV